MEFNIELNRLTELVKAFQDAPGAVKTQLRQGLREALVKVQERARKEHKFRSRTGNVERSIRVEMLSEWPPVGRVWLNPAIGTTSGGANYTADVSYGVYLHEGTGLDGPKKAKYPIRPKNKKCLRWVNAGVLGAKMQTAKNLTKMGGRKMGLGSAMADAFLDNSEGSEYVFAKGVMHPGVKGEPFIYNAAKAERENINKIFNRRIDEAITQAFVKLARGV